MRHTVALKYIYMSYNPGYRSYSEALLDGQGKNHRARNSRNVWGHTDFPVVSSGQVLKQLTKSYRLSRGRRMKSCSFKVSRQSATLHG